jgi:hypothetical protein
VLAVAAVVVVVVVLAAVLAALAFALRASRSWLPVRRTSRAAPPQ